MVQYGILHCVQFVLFEGKPLGTAMIEIGNVLQFSKRRDESICHAALTQYEKLPTVSCPEMVGRPSHRFHQCKRGLAFVGTQVTSGPNLSLRRMTEGDESSTFCLELEAAFFLSMQAFTVIHGSGEFIQKPMS